jgi:hypothetical protein
MGLISHTQTPIEVEVSDRVYNGTIFKQKARFKDMFIHQDDYDGVCTVKVTVIVSPYANNNGAYGERINGKGLSSYEIPLVADNNCAVDPKTGAVKYMRGDQMLEDWLMILGTKEEPLMLQGDYFEMLMHDQSVPIGPMLKDFILQADKAPFSKFNS